MFRHFIPNHFQTQDQPSMQDSVQMGQTNTVVASTSQEQYDHSCYIALHVSIFINSKQ